MIKEAIAVLMMLNIVNGNDYCSVCSDHTMCLFKGIGSACQDPGDGGVNREEIIEILKIHNSLRRLVASGSENHGAPGPQPKASNMLKLTWDREMAKIAQRWADQCTFQHDSCRDIGTVKVGQNIFWSYQIPINQKGNWTQAITAWYEEVENFVTDTVSEYKFDAKTGHYTQIIWATTHSIGCGRRNYGPNKIYVCNYGPAGNWENEPVYLVGEPCSACPENTTCNNGLCERKSNRILKKSKIILESGLSDNSTDEQHEEINLIKDPYPTEYEEPTTTELPIDFNIIDDLDIHDDEEIKKEIEDLKTRIRQLVEKIISRRIARN